jgi:2-methylisocitrate lyase-like PEP mutase family enzyme
MVNANRSLRDVLVRGAGALIPGAANALTARVIQRAGYPALMVTGAGIANSYLGAPDIGLLSVTELAAHVGAIRDAVSLPIIVDGDTGFGNALNVRRTVKLLERAGANAIMLEDQTFPKRCGHFDGKDVIPRSEMVQKIRAAVDARSDKDLIFLARTDARSVEGFAAAIERINAYREAGADVLFVEAPINAEELAAIPVQAPGAHICNMVIGGRTPLLAQHELARLGYAGIVYANAALQASMLAMQTVLEHIRDNGSIAGMESAVMSFDGRQELVDFSRFKQLEAKYSTD